MRIQHLRRLTKKLGSAAGGLPEVNHAAQRLVQSLYRQEAIQQLLLYCRGVAPAAASIRLAGHAARLHLQQALHAGPQRQQVSLQQPLRSLPRQQPARRRRLTQRHPAQQAQRGGLHICLLQHPSLVVPAGRAALLQAGQGQL